MTGRYSLKNIGKQNIPKYSLGYFVLIYALNWGNQPSGVSQYEFIRALQGWNDNTYTGSHSLETRDNRPSAVDRRDRRRYCGDIYRLTRNPDQLGDRAGWFTRIIWHTAG